MMSESVNIHFEFREHESGVYRGRRTEPTLDGLREMEVWSKERREWLPVKDIGIACDVWWFGTSLSPDQARIAIFDVAYVTELIAGIAEQEEE